MNIVVPFCAIKDSESRFRNILHNTINDGNRRLELSMHNEGSEGKKQRNDDKENRKMLKLNNREGNI